LAQVLRHIINLFPKEAYANLLVGLGEGDDAAVYKLNDELALIFTADFFAPVVDDPYLYGAIAAANSMSDVYAMGGEVLMALNITCLPPDMPPDIAGAILRGGADKIAEAGGILVGGHTMDDKEPKYGLAVIGTVHPKKVITKAGAKPGDVLILTKPLGTGVITTALKAGLAKEEHIQAAVEVMLRLNRKAAKAMQEVGVSAATDITGFGFLGHARDIAIMSGVNLRFYHERIPFIPGAKEYAEQWLFPGGTHSNERYFHPWVRFSSNLTEEEQLLLFDAQTSGGLLIAVPPERASLLVEKLKEEGDGHWVVGEVVEGGGFIEVV
jgi:selenide,water dikinase